MCDERARGSSSEKSRKFNYKHISFSKSRFTWRKNLIQLTFRVNQIFIWLQFCHVPYDDGLVCTNTTAYNSVYVFVLCRVASNMSLRLKRRSSLNFECSFCAVTHRFQTTFFLHMWIELNRMEWNHWHNWWIHWKSYTDNVIPSSCQVR